MNTQILIFGASVEYGAWDTEKGGWTQRLKLFLFNKKRTSNKVDFDINSLGISGNNSRDVLKRFEFEAEQRIILDYYERLIIIFAIGKNDCTESDVGVPAEEFENNLKILIKKAAKYTDRGNIVFIGLVDADESKTCPVPWGVEDNLCYWNDRIDQYDKLVKKITKEQDVHYISMRDIITIHDLADGLHPNSQGHEKMFERVKDYLIVNKLL